jgi:hypothetical protein
LVGPSISVELRLGPVDIRSNGTLTERNQAVVMTNQPSQPAEFAPVCDACSEENRPGSVRCARCGIELSSGDGPVDRELRGFNHAQAELSAKLQRERRKTVMIDILLSGGSEFKPR